MPKTCFQCFNEISDNLRICPHCGFNPEENRKKYPLALPCESVLGGRYIIGKVLGQGGFGITYLAKDHKTGKRVAIKEYMPEGIVTRLHNSTRIASISDSHVDNFNYGKRCFLDEARTLSKFQDDPNIVTILAYFEDNGTAYFVMEYLEGMTLQEYLKTQGGKLSWDQFLKIFVPLTEGLKVVHENGVIHRDISPDNIFLTQDGHIKLLDFGAARYSMGEKSQSLDVILKHGFAPKEQYARHGKQGPFTDIYALAATMYHTLTGIKPPDALDRIETDTLIPPAKLGVSMPANAEGAMMKALSVNGEDRFSTIEAMRTAMFLQKPGPGTHPPKPKKWVWIAVCAMVVIGIAAIVILNVTKAKEITTIDMLSSMEREDKETKSGVSYASFSNDYFNFVLLNDKVSWIIPRGDYKDECNYEIRIHCNTVYEENGKGLVAKIVAMDGTRVGDDTYDYYLMGSKGDAYYYMLFVKDETTQYDSNSSSQKKAYNMLKESLVSLYQCDDPTFTVYD